MRKVVIGSVCGAILFGACAAMADANGFVIVRNVLHHYAGSAANARADKQNRD